MTNCDSLGATITTVLLGKCIALGRVYWVEDRVSVLTYRLHVNIACRD